MIISMVMQMIYIYEINGFVFFVDNGGGLVLDGGLREDGGRGSLNVMPLRGTRT
jgi:hypothetical protein